MPFGVQNQHVIDGVCSEHDQDDRDWLIPERFETKDVHNCVVPKLPGFLATQRGSSQEMGNNYFKNQEPDNDPVYDDNQSDSEDHSEDEEIDFDPTSDIVNLRTGFKSAGLKSLDPSNSSL